MNKWRPPGSRSSNLANIQGPGLITQIYDISNYLYFPTVNPNIIGVLDHSWHMTQQTNADSLLINIQD